MMGVSIQRTKAYHLLTLFDCAPCVEYLFGMTIDNNYRYLTVRIYVFQTHLHSPKRYFSRLKQRCTWLLGVVSK